MHKRWHENQFSYTDNLPNKSPYFVLLERLQKKITTDIKRWKKEYKRLRIITVGTLLQVADTSCKFAKFIFITISYILYLIHSWSNEENRKFYIYNKIDRITKTWVRYQMIFVAFKLLVYSTAMLSSPGVLYLLPNQNIYIKWKDQIFFVNILYDLGLDLFRSKLAIHMRAIA